MMNDELNHFGVKGMRWGKRKSGIDYKTKINNISNNKKLRGMDKHYISYAKLSPEKRIARELAENVTREVISSVLQGRPITSKRDLATRIGKIAYQTAWSQTSKTIAARSVASKYDDDGERKGGKKIGLLNREILLVEGMSRVRSKLETSAVSAMNDRMLNEQKFREWGGNVLSEKASDTILWRSGDTYITKPGK